MYPIWEDGENIGTASVEKIGLYHRFFCACRPQKPGRHHVYLSVEERTLDLGLCVPLQDKFVLRTSIPVKHIPSGQMRFYLMKPQLPSDLIPVSGHQPFAHLAKLKTARLVIQSGQHFIRLCTAPDLQDSDLTREYQNKSVYR